MAELIISVSGVRGVIGDSLTGQVAFDFGRTLAGHLRGAIQQPTIVIGRDSRRSGPLILQAFSAGAMEAGASVTDLGIVTTPTVGLMTRFLKASAGVVITASHNPAPYNGIKMLQPDGIALSASAIDELKKSYATRNWFCGTVDEIGLFTTDSRGHAHHVQTVLQYFDTRKIIQKRYRVVLDSINGAGSIPSPMLLGKLGVELIHLNGTADGHFAHTPEPIRENLSGLCEAVMKHRAAVGFAQDPDADRLAIVDENGVYIGEEYTLALCVLNRLMKKKGPVVCNLSTSRMIDDIAARFDVPVIRTPVGEANVAGRMMKENALIGGEGNGGVIDLRVGPIRDSLLGMASILELLTETGKTISQLVKDIPAYSVIKEKIDLDRAGAAQLTEKIAARFADCAPDRQDGIRVDFGDRWVQFRASNTEPIARLIAEAHTAAEAKKLIDEVLALRASV
jgi:phosphomannomutase